MSLSVQDANNLIAELKQKEISLGRPENTWYTYKNHVYGVAFVAKSIAEEINKTNIDEIYVAALLHDISRTEEDREHRFHGLIGYETLINKDKLAAHTAIVHMFPFNHLPSYEACSQMFYNNKTDYEYVAEYLKKHPISEVDLLIQLADNLANKDGLVTIEQRVKEYDARHNTITSAEIMRDYCELKDYFDKKIGGDVYELLQGIQREYQQTIAAIK